MTALDPSWREPPADLPLRAGEVHAWAIFLDPAPVERDRLASLLSSDERSRANAFYFERDRRRFTVGRGALREILGGYAGDRPERLRFRYGERGKPELAEPADGEPLCFNLSHSHGLAVCAVTRRREIGVDVERIRPNLRVDQIVERFFSAREKAAFRLLPPERKREAFFKCWTRKEAYQKSRGEGFFRSPAGFDVTVEPDEPPRLLHVEGLPGEASRWSFRELAISPDYAGAVIVEGSDWTLGCWRWRPRDPGCDSGS